jgi:hypothetical protein
VKTPLLLATRNAGKLRELQAMLADLPVEVLPLPDDAPEVPETAATFAGNAELKAGAARGGVKREASGVSKDVRVPAERVVTPAGAHASRLTPHAWCGTRVVPRKAQPLVPDKGERHFWLSGNGHVPNGKREADYGGRRRSFQYFCLFPFTFFLSPFSLMRYAEVRRIGA